MSELNNLAKTLNERMMRVAEAGKDMAPEIGTIGDKLSLQLQSVKNALQREDYLVEAQTALKPGDRVLVVWCANEPVVTSVLREGKQEAIDPNAPASLIDILVKAYPVGTVNMTTTPSSPASLIGGTWEDSKDVFILLADGSATRDLHTWEKTANSESITISVPKDEVIPVLTKLYPVGSIHLSISETNPGVYFGGTWKKSGDVFILDSDGEATRTLHTWEKTANTISVEATESISDTVLQLRPVGTIYISASETNPGIELGGTWVSSGDVFLLSADGTANRTLHTWERVA